MRGTAKVTRDGDSYLVHENESTYLPRGAVHRLENPGKIALHIVEVQSGSYLGEDDIVRFDDTYGRVADNGKEPPNIEAKHPPVQSGVPAPRSCSRRGKTTPKCCLEDGAVSL